LEEIGIVTLILIIANAVVTYRGLKEIIFLDKFSFSVESILIAKDFKRLISSGFLHVDWVHFTVNMITLYFFSRDLEIGLGAFTFSVLFLISLVGGNLFALYIHRNHFEYSAIGASGAVSGLVFASIALFPGMEIGLLLLPIYFPAWLFGLAYVLYSIYGIKTQNDNIGHEAHLGGGLVGLIVAIIINPNILMTNYFPITIMLIPSLVFLFLIVKKPHLLIVRNPFSKPSNAFNVEDKYNSRMSSKQMELDRILDKISKKGYNKLSKKEKEKLNELSK